MCAWKPSVLAHREDISLARKAFSVILEGAVLFCVLGSAEKLQPKDRKDWLIRCALRLIDRQVNSIGLPTGCRLF